MKVKLSNINHEKDYLADNFTGDFSVAVKLVKQYYRDDNWIADRRTELSEKETRSERNFRMVLDDNRIEYEQNYPITVNGHTYFVDFFLPEFHCVIEVDGGYHLTIEQRHKDVDRQIDIESTGVYVYRITNNCCEHIYLMESFLYTSIEQAKTEWYAAHVYR